MTELGAGSGGGASPAMGAKWGAIIGRHQATQNLADRSSLVHDQLSKEASPRTAQFRGSGRAELTGLHTQTAKGAC